MKYVILTDTRPFVVSPITNRLEAVGMQLFFSKRFHKGRLIEGDETKLRFRNKDNQFVERQAVLVTTPAMKHKAYVFRKVVDVAPADAKFSGEDSKSEQLLATDTIVKSRSNIKNNADGEEWSGVTEKTTVVETAKEDKASKPAKSELKKASKVSGKSIAIAIGVVAILFGAFYMAKVNRNAP